MWNPRSVTFWLLPGTAALAIIWLILRRIARNLKAETNQQLSAKSARSPPESDEDFDWLTKPDFDRRDGNE